MKDKIFKLGYFVKLASKYKIKQSPIGTKGVFADKNLSPNEPVGKVLRKEKNKPIITELGKNINKALYPNSIVDLQDDNVVLKTIKPILDEQELFLKVR